jgi:MFS family permease
MANRQIAGSIASILSGGVAGYLLEHFDAPLSYAYLFMVSSFFMVIGFVAFVTIEEPEKEQVLVKEKHFRTFLRNAVQILRADKKLQRQIFAIFLSYSYFLAMPFVILNANSSIALTGWMLGGFISVQMLGSIFGSMMLWRRIHHYEKMLSMSFVMMIAAFVIALFADSVYAYAAIFLLFGMALDGFNIAGMNLVIEIAPEAKRPIYTALQTNIVSLGLFFPVLGGAILKGTGSYSVVYILAIAMLVAGFLVSRRLR